MAQHRAQQPLTAQRCGGGGQVRRPGGGAAREPSGVHSSSWGAPLYPGVPSTKVHPSISGALLHPGVPFTPGASLHPGHTPLAPPLAASECLDRFWSSLPPLHRHQCAHKAKPAGFAALPAACEQTRDKLPMPRPGHLDMAAKKWGVSAPRKGSVLPGWACFKCRFLDPAPAF